VISKSVARLLRMERNERHLLLEAVTLLSGVSSLLKYGPDQLTGRLVRRASTSSAGPTNERLGSEVAAAVNQAAAHVPSATCLARALTGWVMVTRRHGSATVRLGVNRGNALEFAAHAWLDCNGQRVIGGENACEYTPFPPAP
jgi:Transglutaminase-like superfamily